MVVQKRARKSPFPVAARVSFGALSFVLILGGCSDHQHVDADGHHEDGASDHAHAGSDEESSWAVTAWGERYEIFPEIDPLIAGQVAESHTHVTVLDGFTPLTEGTVSIVLRDSSGAEEHFEESAAKRPGIFGVRLVPAREGEFDLLFRIDSAAGFEEIPGGRVRVGSVEAPGAAINPAEAPADAISFLKEQQWKVPFATGWAGAGELQAGVVAPARITPRPGGDRMLTAPSAGRLEAGPWPYPGLALRRGAPVFRLVPRLDDDVSLAQREAEVTALEAELAPASARAERAERLAAEGILAREESEFAAGDRDALAARLAGARRDLATARRARAGALEPGDALVVTAPFDGVVAAVEATPGQAVEAGTTVAHFVAAGAWWLELALPPRAAARLAPGPIALTIRPQGGEPIVLAAAAARLVSVAPEVDPANGRVLALVELSTEVTGFAAGEAVEAELAGGDSLSGIMVPSSALVDDSGVPVVFVQDSGEGFVRREVRVTRTRGDRALIEGVRAGERIVTRGGLAIRRSTLAGGAGEAHIH